MKGEPFPEGCIITMMVAICFLALGWGVCCGMWTDDVARFRAELVKRGQAEWVVDPNTGKTTFKLLDPKP